MTYARVVNNVAVDVAANPHAIYPPELAGQFISVPDEVRPGWVRLPLIEAGAIVPGASWKPPGTFVVTTGGVSAYQSQTSAVARYTDVVAPPASVTMRQARLALLAAGKLAAVQVAIDALPSPQKEAAQIEWDYSNEVLRHNGFVAHLAPALGLTSAQLDALFVQAARL